MATDDMTGKLFNVGILLQGLRPEECFGRIKSAFQAVVSSKDLWQDAEGKIPWGFSWETRVNEKDKETLFLCKLFEQEYKRQAPVNSEETREEALCSFLMDTLYWELPNYAQYPHNHWTQNWAPFIETKKWMWERVIKEWDPSLGTLGWNTDIFLFLIAVFQPPMMNGIDGIVWPISGNESPYECKAQGRFTNDYERAQLLELIHQRVKDKPVFLSTGFPCLAFP